jgi:Flp pilus assembly protein TadG
VRVPVISEPRHERQDENGAVAVLVGILAVFLIGLSAFTVDLGAAYVSNRNLQKAADAGALAGAQELTQYKGTCNSVVSNSVAVAAAHQTAIEVAKKNYPDASWVEDATWAVKCDPKLKVLLVTFGNSGTTETRFAGVFGGAKKVTTNRGAEATVDVAPTAKESVRPLALCSAAFATAPTSGDFVQIYYPGGGFSPPPQCPSAGAPGNWWTLDCPNQPTGSTKELEDQIRNGCRDAVTVVPGQGDATTPGELTITLEAACDDGASGDGSCMGGDPGGIDSGQLASAWKELVLTEAESLFPVFCVEPQCSASTVEGSGTNSTFPVYKMVAAIVCGYRFSKNEKYFSTTGGCAGNTFTGVGDPDDNQTNYIVLKYINTRTSGSNGESDCALGAECDGGMRRTRLTG